MAVYTELSTPEIEAFLARYALPALKNAEGIRAGVENTNYRLQLADGSQRILTLFEKRVEGADLPFFTALMETLAAGGVPCPKPVVAKDGRALQLLKEKPALIVSFLQGKSLGAIQPAHLGELGVHMARMHLAAGGFTGRRENALGRAGCAALLVRIQDRVDSIAPGLAAKLAHEQDWLQAHWPEGLLQGVIHADLFPDNVFFDEGDTLSGIIDFYFACNDFLAYDLAICLNAWCFEKTGEFNITKAQQMLRAYHAVRPLKEEELAALPVLARGAALRFLLTRAHDALFPAQNALVVPKDPLEYWKKLRFHQSVTHHREYGL